MAQNPLQTRKIKPPQADPNASNTLLLVGVLIGVLFVVVGIIAAGRDDLPQSNEPTPTSIPAPILDNGSPLTSDSLLFTKMEPIAFSALAAPDNENAEQTLDPCTAIQVGTAADGNYFYLDSSVTPPTYWVYGSVTDERGWNGWLPLDSLSTTLPTACP